MSDMNTARKAGGDRWPFATAVLCAIIFLIALFVWQLL
jgi:hypothetical protein